jgi:hypothetical protein
MKPRCVSRLVSVVLIRNLPAAFSASRCKRILCRRNNSAMFDIAVCLAAAVGVSSIIAHLLVTAGAALGRPFIAPGNCKVVHAIARAATSKAKISGSRHSTNSCRCSRWISAGPSSTNNPTSNPTKHLSSSCSGTRRRVKTHCSETQHK